MKERLLQWLIFVLVITLVGGEKSSTDDDEDKSYDISTNEVDDQDDDDPTTRMLQLINNAAIKIIEAPDLSKVISFYCVYHPFIVLNVQHNFRKNLLINRKNN